MKTIDWNELETCRGHSDPSQVPAAIDLLFSSDPDSRKKGYWGLDNHVVVQSDLCNSAPYAARLIVDRLLDERVVSIELPNILYELATGHNRDLLNVGFLAGERIDVLCKQIIAEARSLLSKLEVGADSDTKTSLTNLLSVLEGEK